MQAHPGVRRQLALPQHHDGDALRSRGCQAESQPRGIRAVFLPACLNQGVVRVRGSGHRSPTRAVARVRRSFSRSSSTAASPTTWCPRTCATTCNRAAASASLSSRSSLESCRRRKSSCTPLYWSGTSTTA